MTLVRIPDLTVTEAKLLARMLELAPIEASLSSPSMPPGVAEELKATAASMRTAVLEAITTAERSDSVETYLGDRFTDPRFARAYTARVIAVALDDGHGDVDSELPAAEAALDALAAADLTITRKDTSSGAPMEDWIVNVYSRAVAAIAGYFSELGVPAEAADHNARACLARLAHLEPPLTVERIQ